MQDCTRGAEKDLSHGSSPFDPLASRSEEHTSELQSRLHLVCRLLLEKKKNRTAHLFWRIITSSPFFRLALLLRSAEFISTPLHTVPSARLHRSTLLTVSVRVYIVALL